MSSKLLIILTFSLLLAPLLWGQQEPERRFSAYFLAGINAAQIDGDTIYGYDKIGLSLGARGGVILGKRWEAGIEILFSQQGSRNKGRQRSYWAHLNCIEIPLLIYFKDWEVKTSNNKSFQRIHFGIGASYNRIMGGKLEERGVQRDLFDEPNPFVQNYVMLMADLNVFIIKNIGLNIRWSRTPYRSIRKDMNLYFPYMLTFRAVLTF